MVTAKNAALIVHIHCIFMHNIHPVLGPFSNFFFVYSYIQRRTVYFCAFRFKNSQEFRVLLYMKPLDDE